MLCAFLAKSEGWCHAGELPRQTADPGGKPRIARAPAPPSPGKACSSHPCISSRMAATTVHAINGS
jgi:hypothetical protein